MTFEARIDPWGGTNAEEEIANVANVHKMKLPIMAGAISTTSSFTK
jgi:hypothetical protein